MTVFSTFPIRMLAVLGLVAMTVAPATAQPLNASDMAFAFGGKDKMQAPAATAGDSIAIASARGMTQTEMQDTEGAVAPLVAIGIMTGSRFIVQRYVTQRAATAIVSRGGSVMAANRQQAAAIARNASQGNRGIREFHPGPGQRFTHFHTNPRNGGHVWYGRPR